MPVLVSLYSPNDVMPLLTAARGRHGPNHHRRCSMLQYHRCAAYCRNVACRFQARADVAALPRVVGSVTPST
jgi:hypothetical protein